MCNVHPVPFIPRCIKAMAACKIKHFLWHFYFTCNHGSILKRGSHFYFYDNFGKCGNISLILSLLHLVITCGRGRSKHHHTLNLLLHYFMKFERLTVQLFTGQIRPTSPIWLHCGTRKETAEYLLLSDLRWGGSIRFRLFRSLPLNAEVKKYWNLTTFSYFLWDTV